MKKHYSTIKYHNYIIEGCGSNYELYCSDGMIGTFSTYQQCKEYIDKERNEKASIWNNAVLSENK